MSASGPGDDALRKLFTNPPADARASGDCPDPDRVLAAVMGELPKREARALADHAATCPVCAVAWRFARDHANESGVLPTRPARTRWRSMVAAAAVVAAVLVGVVWVGRDSLRESAAPGYRELPHDEIESLVGDDPLPADAFVLRWTAGIEGARYDILVTDRRLTMIAEASSLSVPEYTVPTENLAEVESGDVVLWQVESHHPDGRKVTSPTFATQLE